MMLRRVVMVSLAAAALAGSAQAEDSGNFVYRLGQDTTSVEHYSRTPAQLVVDQVGRAPRVLARRYVYDYAKGTLTHFSLVVTPPGSTTPTQKIDARVDGDSLRLESQNGTAPVTKSAVAITPATLIVTGSSPWASYEGRIIAFLRERRDSVRTTMYFLGAAQTDWLSIHRLGRDSIAIMNGHLDQFHVAVDKTGHVQGVLPIAGTAKFSVQRVPSVDVPAMTAAFAAREQTGGALGMLSPRDTVNVSAGGAALWVDYGRPGKRGRTVFGGVVPYGEVWRTGANAATQFKTDKALDINGTSIPAGMYTLWTIPTATGWKLVFNSQTGQWGTEHHADQDVATVDMKVETLPQVVEHFTITIEPGAQGGTIDLDWDTTRASVAFTVKAS